MNYLRFAYPDLDAAPKPSLDEWLTHAARQFGKTVPVALVERVTRDPGYWGVVRDSVWRRAFEALLRPYQRRALDELVTDHKTPRP